MKNQQNPHRHSVAYYRQQLVHTLDKILEREQQWFMELEGHAEEVGKPMIEYMHDHISILSDTVVALASGKYKSFASTSDEVAESVKGAIIDYMDYSVASHVRACVNLNSCLVARGITTIQVYPVELP